MNIPLTYKFTPDFDFQFAGFSGAPSAFIRNIIKFNIPLTMYRRKVYVAINYKTSGDAAGFAVDARVLFFREGKPASGEIVYRKQDTLANVMSSFYPNTGATVDAYKWKSADGTVETNILPINLNIEADRVLLRVESMTSACANLSAILGVHSEYPV